MSERSLKAFDFASDATKLLISLATGVIALTVTFLKNVVPSGDGNTQFLLGAAWVLYGLSVLFGLITLLALAGELDPHDASASPSIYMAGIRVFSIGQMILFLLATICIIWFGFRYVDDLHDLQPKPRTAATASDSQSWRLPPTAKAEERLWIAPCHVVSQRAQTKPCRPAATAGLIRLAAPEFVQHHVEAALHM